MSEEQTFDQKVQECIDEIRPMLQRDGGDCELVAIEGKTVKIRFQGACQGCPGARMTLKNVIEKAIIERLPEVEEVVSAD